MKQENKCELVENDIYSGVSLNNTIVHVFLIGSTTVTRKRRREDASSSNLFFVLSISTVQGAIVFVSVSSKLRSDFFSDEKIFDNPDQMELGHTDFFLSHEFQAYQRSRMYPLARNKPVSSSISNVSIVERENNFIRLMMK